MLPAKLFHLFQKSEFIKVGCAFPMVISSDFRMGKHRDDDHEEDAPYFTFYMTIFEYLISHILT